MQLNPQAAQALLSFGSNLSNAAQTPGMGFGQGVISSVAPAMQAYQSALAKAKEDEYLKEELAARRTGRERETTLFEQSQADRETQETLVKISDYMLKHYNEGGDIASAIANLPQEYSSVPGIYSVANDTWREYQSTKGKPVAPKDFNIKMVAPTGQTVDIPFSRYNEMVKAGFKTPDPTQDENITKLKIAIKAAGIPDDLLFSEWTPEQSKAVLDQMGSQDFWSMFFGGMMGGAGGGMMGGAGGGLTPEEEEELRRLEAEAAGATGQFGIAPVVSGTITR